MSVRQQEVYTKKIEALGSAGEWVRIKIEDLHTLIQVNEEFGEAEIVEAAKDELQIAEQWLEEISDSLLHWIEQMNRATERDWAEWSKKAQSPKSKSPQDQSRGSLSHE